MVNGQTGEVEQLNNAVNDIRTNLIQLLSKLYIKFSSGLHISEYQFEDKILIYKDGVLELKGCVDAVRVNGPSCKNVLLGQKIKSYGHLPHSWLIGLL